MTATMALHLGLGSGSRGSTLSAKSRRTYVDRVSCARDVNIALHRARVSSRGVLEQKTAVTSGRSAVGR